jgi:hypothetical protein
LRRTSLRSQLKPTPSGGRQNLPMVLTVLEADVALDREPELRAAYRAAARDPLPPGLVRSALLRAGNGRWRIETVWESRAALEAMRGAGTPRGLLIFGAAGAEPTLVILDVIDTLAPPGSTA